MGASTAAECFYGSVTVGERGQVVIPADARKAMRIEPGDKLLVLGHPVQHGLVLTKLDEVQDVIEFFQRAIATIREVVPKDLDAHEGDV
ncbi:MAG TPA: AbrB/MazE/SpoVT family DNA-binding domain-containing protein [Armatimonadota bacterium]